MKAAIRDRQPARAELILRTSEGAQYWVEADIAPIFDVDGKLTHFVSIQRDITERKRAEAALRDRERSLDTMLANLPGMAYRCRDDEDWVLEYASRGCLILTGYDAEELIENRLVRFLDVIDVEDQVSVRETVATPSAGASPMSFPTASRPGTARPSGSGTAARVSSRSTGRCASSRASSPTSRSGSSSRSR